MILKTLTRKKLIINLVLIVCFIFVFNSISIADTNTRKNILVVNSYNHNYKWTNDLEYGIKSVLNESGFDIHYDVEYMDSKLKNSEEYYDNLYNLYKYKYKNVNYDLIIASDNNALTFLSKYHKELFNETPVVFCGINNFDEAIIENNKIFTGVVEVPNFKETIGIALKLHNDRNKLSIIIDNTETGYKLKKDINKVLIHYNNLEINFIEAPTIESLEKQINNISNYSIVIYMVTAIKDDKGFILSGEETSKVILPMIKDIPVYTPFDIWLGEGVIGGKIIGGSEQGELAATLCKEILKGNNNISLVKNSKGKYMFDYKVLRYFNIDTDELPTESIIINKPNTLYNIERKRFYVITVFVLCIFFLALYTIIYDEIKRRKAEKNLREIEDKYKLLVEILPDSVFIHDENKIYYANNEGLKLLGLTDYDDLKNIDIKTLIHPNNSDYIIKRLKDNLNNNEKYSLFEYKIIKGKDSILDVEVSGGLIVIDSKTYFLSIVRDISERKRAEELQNRILLEESKRRQAIENEKLKTELFSNFSHELKTPLNLILGTIQLLEIKSKDDVLANYKIKDKNPLSIIKQNCYRLLRLVNNIIDITRIDAGYYSIKPSNVNIVSIVEDITLSVAHYIEQKDIRLTFDTEIEEKIIAIDPDKIERIILNLLSNAIKFTNPGDSIDVNIYDLDETIRISVKDSGIGIPDDKLSVILNRFGQIEKHYDRNKQGSGIGLSLVNSLVKMHGGTLTIKSELNKGSEFIIDLPVVIIENDEIEENKNLLENSVERIGIEFSDIYS